MMRNVSVVVLIALSAAARAAGADATSLAVPTDAQVREAAAAAKLVSPYFRQDEKLVRYVLTQPPDRVSYRMLTPTDAEMQQIHDMALKSGILERPIEMKELIDRQFIPAEIKPAEIEAK